MADIRWLGHSCFRIRSKDATIITDPVGKKTGYTIARQTADVVTLSHNHPGHANLAAVKPGYQIIDGPGEYEVHGVFIEGIRTYHDREQGAELGYNTVYRIETGNLTFAHLGDLGHPLSDEQVEALSSVDVLFAPAGGGPLLSASEMAELVGAISPRLLIPMQFRTSKGDTSREPIEPFAKHLGIEMPEPVDRLRVRTSDLSDEMRFVVLKPES